jgi:hypothetical protein
MSPIHLFSLMCRTATLLVILPSLFTSCYRCDDADGDLILTEETKKWVPYTKNQQIIFVSDTQQTLVEILEYTDTIEPYFRGDECSQGFGEIILAKLISHAFQDTIIIKLEMENWVSISNKGFDLTLVEGTNVVNPSNMPNKRFQSSYSINGKIFENVVVSVCETCTSLKEIIYAKNAGLIAFRNEKFIWVKKD